MKYDVKDLPMSIKLAVKSTSLDNIKIVPVDYEIGIRHTTKVLKFFGWEKRLVNKCVNKINKDIDVSINENKDLKFYVYIMGKLYKKNMFMC